MKTQKNTKTLFNQKLNMKTRKNSRVETRILKAMFSYKNIAISTAWVLTAYGSMYAWMWMITLIFK